MKLNFRSGANAIISAVSFSLLMMLIFFLPYLDKEDRLNGFRRLIEINGLELESEFDLIFNSYYLAGRTRHHIYFGNFDNGDKLICSNYAFTDTSVLNLRLNDSSEIAWRLMKTQVDSPGIYMMEGITPRIVYRELYKDSMINWKLGKTYFLSALPISPRSAILRIMDSKSQQTALAKKVSDSLQLMRRDDAILESQGNEKFSTEGILVREPGSPKIFYIYTYRNEFLCLDTNLNLIYKGNTIDTNHLAKIKIANLSSESKSMFASPPLTVNRFASANGDFLYVNSRLIADNEDRTLAKKNCVIDVYLISNGAYQYSFYIPKYHDQLLTDFGIIDDKIIVLFDHRVRVYRMMK